MVTFVIRRLLYSIPVLLATSFLIFTFVSVTADPLARLHANPRITQAQIAAVAHEKRLDRPIIIRYGYWLRDAVTNQFGTTMFSHQPIWPQIKRVLGHTLQLLIVAQIIIVLLGVTIGIVSALRQYSAFDYASTTLAFLGFAMPVFWLALILQVLFTNIFLSWHVRIFYTNGLSSASSHNFLLDRLQHLALPVITLTALSTANYSRFMRASMLEVLNADFTRTARAKGASEKRVVLVHVVRNALIPLVTQVAIDFGGIFGGAIVTENVFNLGGMGTLLLNGLSNGDPYPVMAWLAITATLVIFFNLVADILYGVLDPRIRYD
jgi:ABC-type dipeptide/oligopeptide/nickel transport system permease component